MATDSLWEQVKGSLGRLNHAGDGGAHVIELGPPERAQKQEGPREVPGVLLHPDQPRLDRTERRAIGRQVQQERRTGDRAPAPRAAQGYLPHPAQPRLSGAEVRAQITALAQQLDARREVMARENVEAPERLHLRERDGGYSY